MYYCVLQVYTVHQRFTKRCRLSWLTNSALVYEPKCGGREEMRGSQPMSTAVHVELHKVRTYKEYRSVCPSSELGLSQPLSRQRVCPSPQKQGGGGTLACGWGVGGSPNSDEGHTLWYSLYVRTLWWSSNKL